MPLAKNKISPPAGRLLVLTPGLGAVSTTFFAGLEAVRRGLSQPYGSLTQMQAVKLGPRSENRNLLIKDFLPLTQLEDIVIAGWDIFPDNAHIGFGRDQPLMS